MEQKTAFELLIKMSLELGKPENDYVILGEGNTSAKFEDGNFLVKTSGSYLRRASSDTFVKVNTAKALAILDGPDLAEDEIKSALQAACADPATALRPSIETVFHAFLLTLPDVNFVAHTHPTAVNIILFSVNAEEIVRNRVCNHEVIYCGAQPVFVGCVDPGLALAREIRKKVLAYISKHGHNPKQIFIQNHGLIALGQTANECEAITAMACKSARIVIGANSLGGVKYCDLDGAEKLYE